jgi:hypothetical protein
MRPDQPCAAQSLPNLSERNVSGSATGSFTPARASTASPAGALRSAFKKLVDGQAAGGKQ